MKKKSFLLDFLRSQKSYTLHNSKFKRGGPILILQSCLGGRNTRRYGGQVSDLYHFFVFVGLRNS